MLSGNEKCYTIIELENYVEQGQIRNLTDGKHATHGPDSSSTWMDSIRNHVVFSVLHRRSWAPGAGGGQDKAGNMPPLALPFESNPTTMLAVASLPAC